MIPKLHIIIPDRRYDFTIEARYPPNFDAEIRVSGSASVENGIVKLDPTVGSSNTRST